MGRELLKTYLLDTAAFYAHAVRPQLFPPRIRALLAGSAPKAVCGVSLLEIATHHQRGRLVIAGTLKNFYESALGGDITLVDISPEIALATNSLPVDFPGDPFDRVIAATASVLNFTIVTPDRAIRDAGVCDLEFYPFRPER